MERSTDSGMELNRKQQRFVEEYLVDLNATQAAIRAGYSPASARNQGHRMMTNDDIQNYLQGMMDERAERTRTAADRVLEELSLIGFANIGDYLGVDEDGKLSIELEDLTPGQLAAIKEIKVDERGNGRRVQFKLSDKLAALLALSRHLGMANPKRDHDRIVADVAARITGDSSPPAGTQPQSAP